MEIKTDSYRVIQADENSTIKLEGALRLSGMEEYAPIVDLFNQVVDSSVEKITLDLRELEFLNSSGINVLSKFVIKIRQKQNIQMIVQGSQKVAWQGKSLKNLQRLMPTLQLKWE
ncbi:slr1659 superfamily regulator [Thioflexithrix psekupsensis]|jgi:hypothetical protein|uniref:STAS domain-containing protein n=1 Tax=Thioflexithrix psekupsensis TaxID=1570016 RepID=A0A251X3J6_9GAMM|nr:STAS domain-containing protein [Thioflexithrix psekupsensis]OUD11742.1 hypothetical protein TPSD3_16980 [Thioflexithrix psekupsensis]